MKTIYPKWYIVDERFKPAKRFVRRAIFVFALCAVYLLLKPDPPVDPVWCMHFETIGGVEVGLHYKCSDD